jgi:hypothetical protein
MADDGSVRAELSIKKEYLKHIRQDLKNPDHEKGSVLSLSSTGFDLLGATLLINPGDRSLPQVDAGSALVFVPKPSPLDETLKSAKRLIETMTSEQNSLGRLINDKGSTFELLQAILKNINLTIETTRTKSEDFTDKTSKLVQGLTQAVSRFEKVLEKMNSAETTLGAMINDKRFYELLTAVVDKMDKIMVRTQANMDLFGKMLGDLSGMTGQVPELMGKLDQTMSGMRDITDALKKNFLIRPFIGQPPKDSLAEIQPR